MKIAFFTDNYHPQISGVVGQVETSAKALRELGHEVKIIAPRTPGYDSQEKDVFWIPSIKVKSNPEYRFIVPLPGKTMQKLLSENFDIIHSHGGVISFLAWEIARERKIPYIYTYHTLLNRYTHYLFNGKIVRPKMAEMASRVFCNQSDHVIAPTKAVKKELLSYGVKKPVTIIPGGISLEKFQQAQAGYLHENYNIPKDKVVLLYVGRVGKEKNIDFIIQAYSKVIKKASNTVLVIVGDGTEKPHLQKTTQKLGLEKSVIFTGFVDMNLVPKVYADGDIFLFSSQSETQGLVVVEAMSQGLPLVVVKDGAFDEIVLNGETGFSTRKNVQNYANAVLKLVKDKQLRDKLGKNAKKLILEHYSDKKQAEELVKVYEKARHEALVREDPSTLFGQRFNSLTLFLKMTERFNRFKNAMRLPKW